jgi:hypothetical protein
MIHFNMDLGPLINLTKSFDSTVKKAMQDAARDLTAQAHAHILEEVQSKLHSTREKYIKNLSYKQIDAATWVIELAKDAMFIEEGLKPGTDMLDGLLKSPKAKTSKEGNRYIIIPFEHNKGPGKSTPAQASLTATLKTEFKRRGIPYGKIENGQDGKAKLGLLHSFDVMKTPIKAGQAEPVPHLQGVRVYQTAFKDSKGKETVKKSVMTFRVASSKDAGKKWIHPGLEAKKFLDEAAKWAQVEFESKMKDKILMSISQNF